MKPIPTRWRSGNSIFQFICATPQKQYFHAGSFCLPVVRAAEGATYRVLPSQQPHEVDGANMTDPLPFTVLF